jgi:hypothetical protein
MRFAAPRIAFAVVALTNQHAGLLARVLFALRHLDNGQPSTAEGHLRQLVADWAANPECHVDPLALMSAARSLRKRPEPECQVWADVVDAIRSGDRWALLAARYRNGESSQALAAELGVSDTTMLANLNRRGVAIRGRGTAAPSLTWPAISAAAGTP